MDRNKFHDLFWECLMKLDPVIKSKFSLEKGRNFANALYDAMQSAGMSERAILVNALDNMGWDEIHAFQDELRKGQSVYEDAGGYFKRAIGRLFGVAPRDEVVTYRQATQALIQRYAPPEDRG